MQQQFNIALQTFDKTRLQTSEVPIRRSSSDARCPRRRVSFDETIHEYETYEKYQWYLSEYDRRAAKKVGVWTSFEIGEVQKDIVKLREELFPCGNPFPGSLEELCRLPCTSSQESLSSSDGYFIR